MIKVRINGREMVYPTMANFDLSDLLAFESPLLCDEVDKDYMKVEDNNNDYKKLVDYACPEGRRDIMPDKIIFNGDCTIAFNDDVKFVVKCDKDDKFSKLFGFLYTYFLMNSKMSKSQARKFFDEFIEYDMPAKKSSYEKKVDKVEKVLADKSLSIDEFEKRMRNLLDDYMA